MKEKHVSRGSASQKFLGPLLTPKWFDLERQSLVCWHVWVVVCFLWSTTPLSQGSWTPASIPKIIRTTYMHAYSKRNNNQILHGYQTGCEENFGNSSLVRKVICPKHRHRVRARVRVWVRVRVSFRFNIKFWNLHNYFSDKWPFGQMTCNQNCSGSTTNADVRSVCGSLPSFSTFVSAIAFRWRGNRVTGAGPELCSWNGLRWQICRQSAVSCVMFVNHYVKFL